jgi:hypothetical protein
MNDARKTEPHTTAIAGGSAARFHCSRMRQWRPGMGDRAVASGANLNRRGISR